MDIQLSFVILSFNSEAFLAQCFNSIMSHCQEDGISYEIIVIDNGSTDGSLSVIKSYEERYRQQFEAIFLPRNRGTTYTRNLGLNRVTGQYICILDSDAEILSGSVKGILALLEKNRDIGIIAPQLVLDNGTIQNSVKKFPTFWHKLVKLPKALVKIKIIDNDFYKEFPFESETFVDSAISACWFLKKDLISGIGNFDEKIFYAPEDLDFCIRLYKAGKKIMYYPHVKILHHTQQISHRKPFSRISVSHLFGLLYYFKKHGGWFSTKRYSN